MIQKQFSRGSEWRKWDLHLHTPETKLNDEFNKNWEEYLNKIADSDIDVFGITDYFSFDGFLTLHIKIDDLKENKENYTEEEIYNNEILYKKLSKKVFIPNIELRLLEKNTVNENVNLHILFNHNMKNRNEKLEMFLTHLKLNGKDGKFCNENVKYNSDYTTIQDIKEAIKNSQISDNDYLIVAPINGYGSLRNSNTEDCRDNKIIKPIRDFCHLFFGNKGNNEFTKKEYKKPSILCSDAHKITDISIYNESQSKGFTWIKSDTTFEGLKQILYESNDRIKIQEEKPDKKEAYNVIDSIILKNKKNIPDNEKILSKDLEIKLNQNLNSIIGEKSSGKSFLLFLIARTLLIKQEFDKISAVFKKDNRKDENYQDKYKELLQKIECNIKYKSSELYELKDNLNDRKITYIPQGYLNKSIEEDKTLIKNIEKDIIDIFETKNLDLKKTKDNYIDFLNKNQEKLDSNINNYFSNNEKIDKLEKELIDYGVKREEINKIKQQKQKELKEIIDNFKYIDKNEIELYTKTMKNISEIESQKNIFNISLRNLEDINYNSLLTYFENFKEKILNDIGAGILYNCLVDMYKNNEKQFNISKKKQKRFFKIKILKIDSNILKEQYKIKGIKEKIENQSDLNLKKNNIEKEINDINVKIEKIAGTEKLISEAKEEKGKIWDSIIKSFNEYLNRIFTFCSEYNENLLKIKESIDGIDKLKIEPKFNQELYQNQFENIFDMRCGKNITELYNFNDINLCNYKKHFSKLFENEVNLRYKDTKTQKDLLGNLCVNLLIPKLIIEYDNDIFDNKMSAGKRGILLLKILIEVNTEDKTPILIDQPEDDLDSKSVYKHLVNYIKKAKKRRQIILVSHNPNIVVGCDSEEIIIAEQKNKQFSYVSGSLENSYIKKDENGNNLEISPNTAGIRENVCDILEGGEEAFKKREQKYNVNNK